MASRALRIWERQGRLRSASHRRFLVSSTQSNPVGIVSQGLLHHPRGASSNVGPLFVLTRYVSSTGHQLQHEHDDGEKKKPILGLNFLSKFFGRGQEQPAAVSAEAAAEMEPAESDAPVEAASGEYYVEEGQVLEEGQALESEVVEEVQALEVAEEGQAMEMAEAEALEAESAIGEGQALEAESVFESSPAETTLVETEAVLEPIAVEEKVIERIADEVPSVQITVPAPEAKAEEDIVKSVGEFIKSLPLESVGPSPVQEAVRAVEEKPKSVVEKLQAVHEKPKSVEEKPKPVEKTVQEKPKAVQEKTKAAEDKPKPAAAVTPAADNKSTTAKKPAADKTQKSVEPQADAGTVPEPVFDFLRTKINNASNQAGKPAASTSSSKPSPLKLSSRFEALSSSGSTADRTTAAINMLLDTVEKSTKSPAAPIFDALESLNNKEESTASSPSLKLSLSTPPAEPAPMDAQTLTGEMNTRLTDGKINESITLFEEWRSSIDPRTLECNKPDRALYNLYMQAKLKLGAEYEEFLEIITEMEEAGMARDTAAYNTLIRALFRKKDSPGEAEKLLELMEKDEHAQPDSDSYNLVVVLCALERKVPTAMKFMKTMIEKGFTPSRTTVNEVALSAARSHQSQLAVSLLKDIKASNNKLPMPMLNTCAELLMAASEVDDAECARMALAAIAERPMAKFGPKMILDEGTLICALGTAARTGDKVLCNSAWEAVSSHTRSIGRSPSLEAYHGWIHALSLSGDIPAAFKAVWEFELTHGRKGETDAEAFSPFTSLKSLASACSRGGPTALDAAYYVLEEAHTKKQGVALAAINCIILGCANLWDSERAFQTFEAIENVFGLRPDIHSCNALMHALGRTKLTEDALKVYDYIKEAGFKPDRWTYTLLSDAHLVNHDAKGALEVLKKMVEEGYYPYRHSTIKVWTRCKQHDDNETLEGLAQLEKDLSYRPCFFANARRKLLLDVIKS